VRPVLIAPGFTLKKAGSLDEAGLEPLVFLLVGLKVNVPVVRTKSEAFGSTVLVIMSSHFR
jgi:hypothetical protein